MGGHLLKEHSNKGFLFPWGKKGEIEILWQVWVFKGDKYIQNGGIAHINTKSIKIKFIKSNKTFQFKFKYNFKYQYKFSLP